MYIKKIKKNELSFLSLTILIAFFIRFILLSDMNFYYDEAVYAMATRDFVYNHLSPWVAAAWQPPLFIWIISIPVKLF